MGYFLSKRAKRDLFDIWDYIAADNEPAADRFVETLVKRFKLLGKIPFMGRPRDNIRSGYRSFTFGKYAILYRIVDKDVEILHIVHGSRDVGQYPFEP